MSLSTLLAKIRSQHVGDDGMRPVVALEDFFEGNSDEGSIGCNLTPHPGVARFYDVLRDIRNRHDVQNVLVGITEDMGDEEFPFSDTIYVLTTAAPREIADAAAPLEAELIPQRDMPPAHLPAIASNHEVVTLWWD